MINQKSFISKLLMLGMCLCAIFILSGKDGTLYAKEKKNKNNKNVKARQKLQHEYDDLQKDYQVTMENFVQLLQRLVTIYDELDQRILEVESKTEIHQDALFQIKDVFEKKSMEDETFRIGITLPFCEEPYYLKGVRVERHKQGDSPSEPMQ